MAKKSFLGLSAFQFLAYFRRGLFYTFLPIYLHYFLGLDITASTFYVTFAMISSSFGQSFIWGKVADKLYNRKIMIFIAELIAAAGHLIVWYLHRIAYTYSPFYAAWTIIIGLTCIEFFWSASNVAWSSLISDIVAEESRSSIMGTLSGIGGFGRIFGVVAAAVFLSAGGFRGGGFYYGYLFIITAIVISITAIIIILTISDSDLVYRNEGSDDNTNSDNLDSKNGNKDSNNKNGYFDRRFFYVFLIVLIFINFGRNGVNVIQDFFLIAKYNVSDANLGIFESLRAIFSIFAGFSTPFLIKKFGDWKVFLISPVIVIFCFVGFIFSPFMYLAFIFGAFVWTGQVTITASAYGIISKKIPAKLRGKYFGYYNAVFFLSFGMGSTLVTGPISDVLIGFNYSPVLAYSYAYLGAAILIVIGLVIGFRLFLQTLKNSNSKQSYSL